MAETPKQDAYKHAQERHTGIVAEGGAASHRAEVRGSFASATPAPAVKSSKAPFRPDIEGLRSIAVVAVVAFHYGVPGLGGGYVGVDIFFVISGYLISGLLIDEIAATDRIDLIGFYGRRARRLLPAALVMVSVSLIAGAYVFSPLKQFSVVKAAAASSAYLSNQWFLHESFGYFSPESALNPYLHTWSLSVEEQFYFLWPGCLLLIHRRPLLRRHIPQVILATTLISFLLCLWLTSYAQPWAFYSLPARVWEFGLGTFVSLAPLRVRMESSPAAPIIGWAGVVLTIAACVIPYNLSLFPGPYALLAAMATVCILLSGSNRSRRGPTLLLGTAPFRFIGRLSYSIYLWHWPILVFALAFKPDLSTWGRLECGALTLGCAASSYAYLEQPIRKSRWLSTRPLRSLNLAGSLTAAGIMLASVAALMAHHFARRPIQAMINQQTSENSISSSNGNNCLVGLTTSTPVACVFGPNSAQFTIALIGDSHADQWSTPIVMLATERHWRVVTYLKSSCAVADVPVYNIRLMRYSPECQKWRADAISAIIRLQPNAVIVGEFSSGYVKGNLSSLGDHAVDLRTWIDGLRRSLESFQKAHIPVIVIRDSPTPNRNIRDCLANADWNNVPESSCDTARSVAIDDNITFEERTLVQSLVGTHFVDLTSSICNEHLCPAISDGVIVYRDANHLTNSYATRLLGFLSAALLPIAGT